MKEYYEKAAISNSGMASINPEQGGTPARYKKYILDREGTEEETPSLENGKLVHLYVEDPKAFVVSDVDRPTDMLASWVEEVYPYFKMDLKKGSLSDKFSTILTINHKTWEVVMQFTPDFDENDETALDVILAAHNNVSEQVPIIMSLADKSVRNKSHTAINFVTELEDGVAFHKEVELFEETPKRGHIKYERYYHGYEDVDNKGQEVVRVSYDWTMDRSLST